MTEASTTPTSSAAGVQWNLSDLYTSRDDPALHADRRQVLADAEAFATDYRGRVADLSPGELAEAMTRLEAITARIHRGMIYAHLRFAGNTGDPANGAMLQASREHATAVNRHLLFFDLEWIQVPDAQAQAALAQPELARWAHHLETLRDQRPHMLSEPEEQILNVKVNTGAAAFQRLFDEVTGGMTVSVPAADGATREVSLQEALAQLYRPERDARRAAAEGITTTLKQHRRVTTFVFNTLVQDHADNDRLRHRRQPMQARNLDNEIDQASVDALLNACDTGMPLVARYYDLKRRLLGYHELFDYDRYSPLFPDLPSRSYAEAQSLVLEAYHDFAPEMADVAKRFFDEGWIDAEPRPGKQGGAFSAATLPDLHPYILLNYSDTMRDVMTLAHEMGHGIHQYLSAPQGLFQFRTPLTTAETASVFGEMLTFRKLMADTSDPRTRLGLLCGKLEDIFATVFRQAAMTRFEQTLHLTRRGEGELSGEAIGELWLQANQAMFGESVQLSEGYRWWWSYIPHFVHTPFYCYAYSFGELLVLALYHRYEQEGDAFRPQYLEVLKAGGSERPQDLMRKVGMDIADPAFWQQGVVLLEGMVAEAETLAGQVGT